MGDPISDEHHVVRHVGHTKINEGEVDPDVFKGETLSVNWLEFADGTKDEQLARVRLRIRRKVGSKSRFAELNVGRVRGISKDIDVVEDPLPAENGCPAAPCHAEIIGLPKDACTQKRVSEAIADSVIALHEAKSPKAA